MLQITHSEAVPSTNEWTKLSTTFKVPDSTVVVRIGFWFDQWDGGYTDSVLIDDFSVSLIQPLQALSNVEKVFGISDASFELGGTSWEDWGNTAIVDSVKYAGSKSMLVIGADAGGNSDGGRGQVITGWAVGDSLNLSCFGKYTGTSSVGWYKGYAFIDLRDADGKRIAAHATNHPTGTEWEKLTVGVRLTADVAKVSVGTWLEAGGDTLTGIYYDNFRLTTVGKNYTEITNSGFENDSAGWDFWVDYPAFIETGAFHSGEKSLRIGPAAGGIERDIFGLIPGQTYTLSAWAKDGGTATGDFYAKCFKDSAKKTTMLQITHSEAVPSTNEWTKLSTTFKVPDSTVVVRIGFWFDQWNGAYTDSVLIDDFSVSEIATQLVICDYTKEQVSLNTNRDSVHIRGDIWQRNLDKTGKGLSKLSIVPTAEAPAGYNLTEFILKDEALSTQDWDGLMWDIKEPIRIDSTYKYLHIAYFAPEKTTLNGGNFVGWFKDAALKDGGNAWWKNEGPTKSTVAGVWYDQVIKGPTFGLNNGKVIGHFEPYMLPKNATSYVGSIILSQDSLPRFVNILLAESITVTAKADSVEVTKTLAIKAALLPKYATNAAYTQTS